MKVTPFSCSLCRANRHISREKRVHMESFNFKVDIEECISCGNCIKTCSSAILKFDENDHPYMLPGVDGIVGWYGCYRCQHCLAVCPQGAISIMNRDPDDSILPSESANARQLEALMRNRRACRSYIDKEVPREVIDDMLRLLGNVPTGSNNQTIDFNVVYKKAEMDKFRKLVHDEAFRLAEQGIYPGIMSKRDFESQVKLEPFRNPGDMFFVNAPHILVIHSLKNKGQWMIDPVIAATWFELICASRGIGSIILTFPVAALSHMPEIQKMLQIPDAHYYCCILGFGYPQITYARGVQREGIAKIREITF